MKHKKSNHIPLGIPLILTGIGTIASLLLNKKLHAPLGVLFAALSVWHGYQHRKKLAADARNTLLPRR